MQDLCLVEPNLIANTQLLRHLERQSVCLPLGGKGEKEEADKMRELAFLAFHSTRYAVPDHIFRKRWEGFIKERDAAPASWYWVAPALSALAEHFLEKRHGGLAIKQTTFADWQVLLSRISCLPLHSALLAGDAAFTALNAAEQRKKLRSLCDLSLFITPHDAALEDYIRKNGLNETHLHLNGSTPAEYTWLRALINPDDELEEFIRSYHEKDTVRELCHSIDSQLNPELLLRRIRIAQLIRSTLIKFKALNVSNKKPSWLQFPPCLWPDLSSALFPRPPICRLPLRFEKTADMQTQYAYEMEWQIELLRHLKKNKSPTLDRLFQLYLLIKNQYLQLMVQREDLFGFDEFQKITLHDLREKSEKNYLDRFKQFHGDMTKDSTLAWFEGRFSPKSCDGDNIDMLKIILGDYLDYLTDEKNRKNTSSSLEDILDGLEKEKAVCGKRKLRLALVAHFIKKGPSKEDEYHYQELRCDIQKRAFAIGDALKTCPGLRQWLRGIDAASNELHAPPDVFAPVFRYCRRIGIEHMTYHVGEDFMHLIGGIRQIDDAIRFLGLREGDHIGHGTAVGIDPQIWLDSMPGSILLTKGEWMLDMLSVWRMLGKTGEYLEWSLKAASEACSIAGDLFGTPLTIEELNAIMELRQFEPSFVFEMLDKEDKWHWQSSSLDDAWREEAHLIAQKKEKNRGRFEKIALWWRNPGVIKRKDEFNSVPEDFLPAHVIIAYQQAVLKEMEQKRLLIETLPTSNVSISQYRSIREHHIYRWLGIPGAKKEGDPQVMITVGTDDPGIFATNMKSEFYHIYETLRNDFGLSDKDAIDKLHEVNERGRIYSFHEK